jgi:hypothetical protein
VVKELCGIFLKKRIQKRKNPVCGTSGRVLTGGCWGFAALRRGRDMVNGLVGMIEFTFLCKELKFYSYVIE